MHATQAARLTYMADIQTYKAPYIVAADAGVV